MKTYELTIYDGPSIADHVLTQILLTEYQVHFEPGLNFYLDSITKGKGWKEYRWFLEDDYSIIDQGKCEQRKIEK
jgi:hypothetical protein